MSIQRSKSSAVAVLESPLAYSTLRSQRPNIQTKGIESMMAVGQNGHKELSLRKTLSKSHEICSVLLVPVIPIGIAFPMMLGVFGVISTNQSS